MKKFFSGTWAILCLAGMFIVAVFSAQALQNLRGSLKDAVERGKDGGCDSE